jgi:hypothetical protein
MISGRGVRRPDFPGTELTSRVALSRRPTATTRPACRAPRHQLRAKRQTVEATAQDIHDQLDALDPVTRSAVIARLTGDAAKDLKEREPR